MLQNLLPKNLPNLLNKSNFQKELNLITEVTKDNIPTNSVDGLTNKFLLLTAVISSGLISVTYLNYQFTNSKIELQNLENRISSRYEDLFLKTRNLPEINKRFEAYSNAKNTKARNLYIFEFLDKISTFLQSEELVKIEILPEIVEGAKSGKNFVTLIYNSTNLSIMETITQSLKNETRFKNLQTEKILIENENYQFVIKGELYER